MTTRELVRTNTFTVVDEKGRKFTVNEYTSMMRFRGKGGESHEAAGLKELHTSEGFIVNRIEKGKYEILLPLGRCQATSDDPNAS
jgi:hypothetical protein